MGQNIEPSPKKPSAHQMGPVFFRSEEILINSVGVIFMVLTIISLFTRMHVKNQRPLIELIIANLFFNGLHVMATYVNILYHPETRLILKKNGLSPKKHLIFISAIFVFMFGWHPNGFFDGFFLKGVLLYLIAILPSFHAWRQSIGVSLLENLFYLENGSESHRHIREKREKMSRRLEHTAGNLGWIGSGFMMISMLPAKYLFASPTVLNWIGIALAIICAVLFLVSFGVLCDRKMIYRKLMFSCRHVCRLFAPHFPFGAAGSMACHGTEYMFVNRKLVDNSRRRMKLGMTALGVCATLYFTKFFVDSYYNSLTYFSLNHSMTITKVCVVVGATLTYYHYYLDSILFRMKDTSTRNIMGPLLLKNRATPNVCR